jgi:diguanylate cyclase (GGDEF)-like protein
MKKNNNYFILLVFILISASILYFGQTYKTHKIDEYTQQEYASLGKKLNDEIASLIEEKKNATLALAISYSNSDIVNHAIKTPQKANDLLKKFSLTLREETDFKNVWIQLIDHQGTVIARSWTEDYGDNLALIRDDVQSMINKPETKVTISVGRYDMTFKAMVPLFIKENQFIGFIEVITHFNSIAEKIKERSFEPVILVNKKYKKQLIYPFSKTFINDNYVANKNADKTLTRYIQEKGLEYFISSHSSYIVDDERDMLVINYALFDTQKQPMANFLLFKPLKELTPLSLRSLESSITLYMLLAIVIVGFLSYLLSNKKNLSLDAHTSSKIFLFLLLFSLLLLGFYFLLHWDFEKKKEDFLAAYEHNILIDYKIIYKKFSSLSETIFETTINKPEVLNLIARAYDENQKDAERKALYEYLISDYEYFKTNDLRQLHFHLKNNESFLRFHRPAKFGDDLTKARATVTWVNANHQSIEGFEEGKIFNGFRHVFPLVQHNSKGEKRYLGSVELSFSAHAIGNEFATLYDVQTAFIIHKDVVNEKVFKEEKYHYEASEFDGFLYEKSVKKQFEHAFRDIDTTLIDPQIFSSIGEKILHNKIITVASIDDSKLFSFVSIRNPVSNKVVAAFILQKDDLTLKNLRFQFILLFLAGFIILALLFLYIYNELSSKKKYQLLSQKTQKILDAQKAIVIITNGKTTIDVNKKFLDFFNYKSLEKFQTEHMCICEFFEEDDRFFHLGKIDNDKTWAHYLESRPLKEHIVAMNDIHGMTHIFNVSLNHFDDNYLISFSDISETMIEHFSLAQRATHDTLTGIYNRDYVDTHLNRLISEAQSNQLALGVILFDIDHFKQVNDTYGHNRGDTVLKHLVSCVESSIRQEDILVRWGGEEFLLLVKTKSLQHLHNMSEHIRTKVETEPFEEIQHLSCSFGATLYRDDEPIEQTIERSDRALYEAKSQGRNRVISK